MKYIPDRYEDQIQLLLAADDAPDVMLIQDEPFHSYAEYGKFEDLTEWVHSNAVPVDWDTAFWDTCVESFSYKGRNIGVPVFGGNVLVFYNREMFRKLGVDPPDDDWTFDDFVEKARELTNDFDNDGRIDTFGFSQPTWIYFLPWTWGFGANYLNENRTEWTFTGPEAVAATRFYQDLRHRLHVSPSLQEMPGAMEAAMFMTGHVGMTVSGPWNSPQLKTAGIDFDVVHIPYGPTGKRYTRATWDGLCLFANSPHKEEGLRFIAYCLTDEAQSVVGRYTRSIPSVKASKDSFVNPDNGWHEEKFVEALEYARMQPITRQWQQMIQVMNPVYELLNLNKITPEETVERMDDELHAEGVFPIKEGSE
jgi:multiple sugar transport system substrate-binding protein